ncbi:Maf family protein [Gracilimonas mengyeensis]|uniref:dTTP/UTP pyrophosphatase n=1 Tax=Gracilimonas mengyeensis TaxID=1302730 RepID=A0A521E0N0_9BACT|nr:Maf family protein [Gracilimonas mengyeensis]SMO77514.1 septum formation protein [Gracilimonas mengyeensis]
MHRIILASKSPRRKKLLEQIGFTFEVIPSHAEENPTKSTPEEVVCELAELKATEVAASQPGCFIIGSDTIVEHEGEILGKPATPEEAKTTLKRLSETTHRVYTGVSFVKTDKNAEITGYHSFYEQTKVTFSALGEEEIDAYVKKGHPMDKAGAYGIQDDLGAIFVEKIEGDYYNVVGFPINRFFRELKHFYPELATLS